MPEKNEEAGNLGAGQRPAVESGLAGEGVHSPGESGGQWSVWYHTQGT